MNIKRSIAQFQWLSRCIKWSWWHANKFPLLQMPKVFLTRFRKLWDLLK